MIFAIGLFLFAVVNIALLIGSFLNHSKDLHPDTMDKIGSRGAWILGALMCMGLGILAVHMA